MYEAGGLKRPRPKLGCSAIGEEKMKGWDRRDECPLCRVEGSVSGFLLNCSEAQTG